MSVPLFIMYAVKVSQNSHLKGNLRAYITYLKQNFLLQLVKKMAGKGTKQILAGVMQSLFFFFLKFMSI